MYNTALNLYNKRCKGFGYSGTINCAKIRARVEHALGVMKSKSGFSRIMYRTLERTEVKFDSLTIAYNFYRLGFLMRTKDNCA